MKKSIVKKINKQLYEIRKEEEKLNESIQQIAISNRRLSETIIELADKKGELERKVLSLNTDIYNGCITELREQVNSLKIEVTEERNMKKIL